MGQSRRWTHVLGNATLGIGTAAYLLAFALPAWHTERHAAPDVIDSGMDAFWKAFSLGGAGGFLAWCANPLFWTALLAWKTGWPVTTFVLSASAVTLGIAGASIFAADHRFMTPVGGYYVWIAGIGTAGIGMLLGFARRGPLPSPSDAPH